MRRLAAVLLGSAVACGAGLGAETADPCGGLRLGDVAGRVGIDFVHERGARGDKHLPETMGSGVAWIDHDGDGWLDLYVVQSGPFPPGGEAAAANRLYRNVRGERFEEVPGAAGAGDRGYGQGVVAGDVDGDGHVDLYVCNYGPDALFRNRGDGTFEDVTQVAGLGLGGWSSSAALADADGDGDLDLYVTRYVEFDPDEPIYCGDPETGERRYCDPTLFRGAHDVFFRNDGSGRFADETAAAGLADADGKGLGVVFTDLDDDGRPDLYVANDLTVNLLYRNAGAGRFEALSLFSGAGLNADGKAEAGMGLAVGDFDGDLDPDLVVTNFDVETNTLYTNLGGMRFEDAAARSGFGPPSFNLLGFGVAAADFDRDGRLDVYVTNGHIFERPRRESIGYGQRDLLLFGDGRGRFEERRCGPAAEHTDVGRGLAAADYDNDGDVDLALVNSGGPLRLLRNDGAGGDWLGLVLSGAPPNRGAVGARAVLTTERGRQVRWRLAGDSYQSSGDPRLLFGIAAGDRPLEVEVRWPSGRTSAHAGLEPGRYHELRESASESPGGAAADAVSDGAPLARLLVLALALSLAVVLVAGAAWWILRAAEPR